MTKRFLCPTCKVRSSSLSAWTSAEGLSVPVSSETRQRQKVLIWEDAKNVNKTVKTFQTWVFKQTAKKPPSNIGPSTSKQKKYIRLSPLHPSDISPFPNVLREIWRIPFKKSKDYCKADHSNIFLQVYWCYLKKAGMTSWYIVVKKQYTLLWSALQQSLKF